MLRIGYTKGSETHVECGLSITNIELTDCLMWSCRVDDIH